MFRAITGITNTRVFSMDSRLKLDDKVALTIFDPSFIDDFCMYDCYEGVFVYVLLFPLMSVYGDTSGMKNIMSALYASIFLYLHHMEYHNVSVVNPAIQDWVV